MTVNDLERRDARGQIFQAYLLNNARMFDLERPNSARKHVGRGVCLALLADTAVCFYLELL